MRKNTAIITGAGRGIGRGIALALAKHGWNIAINYRGNAAAAAETLEMVNAADGQGIVVQANIADSVDRERLITETTTAFGRMMVPACCMAIIWLATCWVRKNGPLRLTAITSS